MNVLQLLAHSIEEHDQLELLSGLGYDVFSLGGYIDPAHPHDPKRPPVMNAQCHPELKAVVDGLDTNDNLRAAKDRIPDALIDWADAIIVHHYEGQWIGGNWPRIRHKRVIWRTVGQSVENNERTMAPYRADGLQIVRYSPKERNIPGYIGEDAVIRFWKDSAEWSGWTGEEPVVINITQHLYQRDPWTNWRAWENITGSHGGRVPGLPRMPLGPGSEAIGGPGELTYDEMKGWLRRARCYLYTGTQPASYTLGLIEAMMTGIPVVSIGPEWHDAFPYGPQLFEGHEIAGTWHEEPRLSHDDLTHLIADPGAAKARGDWQRARAIAMFGRETIAAQWRAFLGAP